MSAAWGGHSNGRIPASALAQVPGAPAGYLLRAQAAADAGALIAWLRAKHPELRGVSPFTGTYRPYQRQVELRQEWCDRGQCTKAATPGTSNHGWAQAADWRPEFWLYMQRYEAEVTSRFGWVWPAWAKRIVNGVRWESWHWEHTSGRQHSPIVAPVTADEQDEVMRKGDSGPVVEEFQQVLSSFLSLTGGWTDKAGRPLGVDGDYGDQSVAAIIHAVTRLESPTYRLFGAPMRVVRPLGEVVTPGLWGHIAGAAQHLQRRAQGW